MKSSELKLFVCACVLFLSANCAFSLTKGTQWVRSHEFPLGAMSEMGQSSTALMSKYYDFGATFYLRHNGGISPAESLQATVNLAKPWQVFAGTADATWISNNVVQWMNAYPGGQGWHIGDEGCLTLAERQARAALLNQVRALVTDPNVLIYTGFFGPDAGPMTPPQFATYIHNCMVDVAPDVLLTSCYPFYNNITATNYFDQLKIVRDEGLAANVPYWVWAQAFGFLPMLNIYEPSESDMRFQAFTSLAFGYTGILYWTYDSSYDPYTMCILNSDGMPSHIYNSLQGLTSEIKMFGNTLAYLRSTAVGWVQGGSGVPSGISAWAPGDGGNSKLLSISVDTSGTSKNGVIGNFVDDSGGKYFMLVNTDHAYDANSAVRQTSFTITFDSSVNTILTIDRSTGWLKRINLVAHSYTFTLPGGTGDIFKYDDGKGFPGQFTYWQRGIKPAGDINNDYKVDLLDLDLFVSGWLD